ncbi:hypothetical protein G3I44_13630 [Halogeometricum borinquense]|uniref:Uncharacterized protein n=1 Tax=Halogeometricum borinquense TaxID=60847 RepID=A0A6C0UI41_9EURY|nr:hypothetical protein [Halogeometricum borinquense]QIB75234.1 hypothetical protein G3I44_13630 [Halogeometricum borinquense]
MGIIVKEQLCGEYCSGCPHGPYAYRVTTNGDGTQNWEYLGKASEVDGGTDGYESDLPHEGEEEIVVEEWQEIDLEDFPEEEPTEDWSFETERGTEIEVEFRDNSFYVTSDEVGLEDDEFVLETEYDSGEIVYNGMFKSKYKHEFNGETTHVKIEQEGDNPISEFIDTKNSWEQWKDNAEDWVEDQPLLVKSEEKEYEKQTPYRTMGGEGETESAEVLTINKDKLSDEQSELWEKIQSELDTVRGNDNNYTESPEFLDEDDAVDAEDLYQKATGEEFEPTKSVRGISMKKSEFNDIKEEAKRDGEKKKIGTKTVETPNVRESDTGSQTVYVNSDGEIEEGDVSPHH